jgi:hypothetical protein
MEALKQELKSINNDSSAGKHKLIINLDLNGSANKNKRKRRSKNDPEGRQFKCDECGKCYLSIPALTCHKKTKHGYGVGEEKKGRGRPRKNVTISALN